MDVSSAGLPPWCCSYRCWPLPRHHHGLPSPTLPRIQAAPNLLPKAAAQHPWRMEQPDGGGVHVQPPSHAFFGRPAEKLELLAIRENATRSRLLKKLSEANQYGRHLQRQLQEKEQALTKCKNEFVAVELELKALLSLAQEVAQQNVLSGMRKINGKYIQSHLVLRLKEIHERLHSHLKDVDTVCYRDVPIAWYGMAEDVKVMGSFDGWSQGEQLSPEGSGTFIKFFAILKLPPGRYELKFLVDGEWRISSEWPTVGEGHAANNLLLVK